MVLSHSLLVLMAGATPKGGVIVQKAMMCLSWFNYYHNSETGPEGSSDSPWQIAGLVVR